MLRNAVQVVLAESALGDGCKAPGGAALEWKPSPRLNESTGASAARQKSHLLAAKLANRECALI